MTILLAVVAGLALGWVLESGGFCFHSTWRRTLAAPRDFSLVRAYLLMLVVSTPIVQLLIAAGIIDPFIPSLAWPAAVGGGLLFGAGMVVASTCISGMFYKLGAGMLGMFVALAAWAVGDLLTFKGFLSGVRDDLNASVVTVTGTDGSEEVATVESVFGTLGVAVTVLFGFAIAAWLMRSHRQQSGIDRRESLLGWVPLGLATAAVMVVGWLLARGHDFNYPFGTAGVPSDLWDRVADGSTKTLWIPLGLVSVVPGAWLASRQGGRFRARGESAGRYAQLVVGGLMMGVGAAIAGGCNLGHSMVGVPLLSLGSIVTTVAIIAGVAIADRVQVLLSR